MSKVLGRVKDLWFVVRVLCSSARVGVYLFDKKRVIGRARNPRQRSGQQLGLYLDGVLIAESALVQTRFPRFGFWTHTFFFRLDDVWDYADRSSQFEIRYGSARIYIRRHGWTRQSPLQGELSVKELEQRMASGSVFNQFGALQPSMRQNYDWQKDIFHLYQGLSATLESKMGYVLYAWYGTLLGAVREGDFINHDHDFDACVLMNSRAPRDVKREAQDLALMLSSEGYCVIAKRWNFYVSLPENPKVFIDLFYIRVDLNGEIRAPFGVASTRNLKYSSLTGSESRYLGRNQVLCMSPAEEVVEFLYGSTWRQPNGGFSWDYARQSADTDSSFSESEVLKLQTRLDR